MGHHQVTNKAGLVGWYDVNSDTFEPIVCDGCDQPFTQKAWDNRHWYEDGEYHDHCCPLNGSDDPEHGTYHVYPLIGAQIVARGYEVNCPVCGGFFHIIALDEAYNCDHCDVLLDLSWSEQSHG